MPKHVPSRLDVTTRRGQEKARKLRVHGDKQWQKGWLAAAPSQDPKVLVEEYGCTISPMFLREPEHQKDRACCDYRYENSFELTEPYSEEDLRHVNEWGEPGMFVWQKDVEACFPHIFFRKRAQRHLVQDWGPPPPGPGPHRPRYSVPLVQTFGWCRSPGNWVRVRRASVEQDLKREGHRSSWFADDGLGGSADKAKAQAGERRAAELFAYYGLREAKDKGQGNVAAGQPPLAQTVTHLGLDLSFETAPGVFSTPQRKMRAIVKHARGLLGHAARNRRWVPRRWLQQYYHLLLSLLQADREARFRTRCLIECCKAAGCFKGRRGQWSGDLKLDRRALGELRWGAAYETVPHGRCMWRPPVTHAMATDASKEPGEQPSRLERLMDGSAAAPAPTELAGWGAVYFPGGGPNTGLGLSPLEAAAALAAQGRMAPVVWPHARVAHGIFSSKETKQMIAWLEMRAVRYAIRAVGLDAAGRSLLQDATLLLWEDNMNCVSIINKMVSRSPVLHREYSLLHAELAALNIDLICRYVASAQNPSDFWTRLQYRSDWRFSARVTAALFRLWGTPTVDRFAQPHDHVVARFNCPYDHPAAEAKDAWTQRWAPEFNWLNPPWAMLGRVCQRLRMEPTASAVVVVPCFWARWYPQLLELAVDGRLLPLGPGDIIPGPIAAASPEPLRKEHWRLAAYFVPSGLAARASRRPTLAAEGGLPELEMF